MNDRQNMVFATAISLLILVVVYLCPWRIESSGEIQFSPIYQPPMSYARSYNSEYSRQGSSRIISEEARIDYGILSLEVLAVIAAGGLMYIFYSDHREEEESTAGSA